MINLLEISQLVQMLLGEFGSGTNLGWDGGCRLDCSILGAFKHLYYSVFRFHHSFLSDNCVFVNFSL